VKRLTYLISLLEICKKLGGFFDPMRILIGVIHKLGSQE
jgi:hypothetical protein